MRRRACTAARGQGSDRVRRPTARRRRLGTVRGPGRGGQGKARRGGGGRRAGGAGGRWVSAQKRGAPPPPPGGGIGRGPATRARSSGSSPRHASSSAPHVT